MPIDMADEIGKTLAIELKQAIAPLIDKIKTLENKVLELESRPTIPGPQGEKGIQGERGSDGESGIGMAGALIDQQGNLVITLTNGAIASLGRVVGADGKSITRDEITAIIVAEIDKIPKPKDGKDGKDGLGFDDLIFDNERTMTWKRGEDEIVMKFPAMIDRGVYKSDQKYERGDCVSWDGSIWTAQSDTSDKPGQGSPAWRLSVKRGRDGKDGKSIQGPPGPPGRDGRDLTQLGPDGSKW